MSIFNSDGVSIYYEVHGQGQSIVLLHGFSSSLKRNWKDAGWVKFLTKNSYQVIGLDMRGHGHSDKLYRTEDYTTVKMSSDVLNLMDHLNVAQAHLIGYSMGGGIALHLSMYHAERFLKIAVGGVGDVVIREFHDPNHITQIAEALESDNPESITSPIGQEFRAFAEKTDNDLKALSALMRGPGWPGDLWEIKPIDRPLLIVVAEKDRFMASTERLAQVIPHARFVTILDRNHNTVVGDERFKGEVMKFLRGSKQEA